MTAKTRMTLSKFSHTYFIQLSKIHEIIKPDTRYDTYGGGFCVILHYNGNLSLDSDRHATITLSVHLDIITQTKETMTQLGSPD